MRTKRAPQPKTPKEQRKALRRYKKAIAACNRALNQQSSGRK